MLRLNMSQRVRSLNDGLSKVPASLEPQSGIKKVSAGLEPQSGLKKVPANLEP